jgi:elongation factor 1-beta
LRLLSLQEDDDDLDPFGEETEEEKAASEKREAEKKASGKPKVGEYGR